MRYPTRLVQAAALTAAVCPLSCATSSTAILKTTWSGSESGFSTDIVAIDGTEISGSRLVLEPGRHVVEAVGTSKAVGVNSDAPSGVPLLLPPAAAFVVGNAVAYATRTKSDRMKACFIARPGRTYEVRVIGDGGGWHIQVFDDSTTYEVQSPCKRAASVGDTRIRSPGDPGR
jgi:hypothetical protein